jgi:hypothetical protein
MELAASVFPRLFLVMGGEIFQAPMQLPRPPQHRQRSRGGYRPERGSGAQSMWRAIGSRDFVKAHGGSRIG